MYKGNARWTLCLIGHIENHQIEMLFVMSELHPFKRKNHSGGDEVELAMDAKEQSIFRATLACNPKEKYELSIEILNH